MRQLSLSITKTPWEVAKYSTKLTNTTRIALLFIAFMSILSWFYYYSENLTLAYNDARSHLNISRRVVDSLQPGLAQLGTVWLPLQHVLQLPTIWVDYLYHSGISGSLISILAFILSSYILAKIARVLGFSDFQSVLLLVVFSLNPNLLYMQTSPMTESLLIFTLVFSTYYLLLWEKTGSIGHLIIAAFGVFLAVLARYDGWFFYLYALVAVFLVSLLKSGFRRASANVVLFGAIPGFAVFLWLLWNQLIFGNFLEFMNGSFSAKAQQDILLAEGRLLTKGSLAQSAYTYALTVIENSGLLVVILGVLGVFRTIYITRKDATANIITLSLIVPVVFNVLSLFLGHSVIHLPSIPPYAYFNVRYGLMALPMLAFGIAYLFGSRKYLVIILMAAVGLQYSYFYYTHNIITIKDARIGASGFYLDDIGDWLNQNASDGLILVATSSHDALIFTARLPLSRYVSEGMIGYWDAALKTPSNYVKYIVMHDGDLVSKSMKDNKDFEYNYELVFKGNFSDVYKLKTIYN